MDFVSFLGVIRRHWFVVLLCLMVTAGAVYWVHGAVKPSYRASASIVLLTPKPPLEPDTLEADHPQNPFLSFGGSLGIMASIMTEAFQDPTLREAIEAGGAVENFTVAPGGGDDPLLLVGAEGKDAAATMATLDVVVNAVQQAMQERQLQAGATPSYLITGTILSRSVRPNVEQGSRTRAVATVGLLGVALAVGMAFLIEAFQRRGRPRQQLSAPREAATTSILEREAERTTAEAREGGAPRDYRWARRDPA